MCISLAEKVNYTFNVEVYAKRNVRTHCVGVFFANASSEHWSISDHPDSLLGRLDTWAVRIQLLARRIQYEAERRLGVQFEEDIHEGIR